MSNAPSTVWVAPRKLRPSRWNAEFYRRDFAEMEAELESSPFESTKLRKLAKLFTGPFGSKLPACIYNTPNGIPLLRVQNIGELFLNETDMAYIPHDVHQDIIRSKLEPGDLALAKAGRLGALSRIPTHISECNITQHIVGVKVNAKKVSPDYLAAFFLSKYGRFQLERQGVGTIIKYLGIEETRDATIPLPSYQIQAFIGAKIKLAEQCHTVALVALRKAEKSFSELLRIADFQPSSALSNYISAYQLKERISGDFYLKKYFELEEHLRSLDFSVKKIRDIVDGPIIRTSTPKKDDSGNVPCILTSDIEPYSISWDSPSQWITAYTHKGHYGRLKAYDVVYASICSPSGKAALVLPQWLPMSVGGDVSIIRAMGTKVNPGFLCLYLNSVFGLMQSEQYSRGSVQRRVYPEDIGSFLISLPPLREQHKIGSRIIKFQNYVAKAHLLTSEAKSHVEALIEGTLDTDAIMSSKLKPPTWEDIEKELKEENK